MKWHRSDVKDAKYLGIMEFHANGEWYNFAIMRTEDKLVFGNVANIGFIESGYLFHVIDDVFSIDEHLQVLYDELYAYYVFNQEPELLIYNERM